MRTQMNADTLVHPMDYSYYMLSWDEREYGYFYHPIHLLVTCTGVHYTRNVILFIN